VIKFGPLIETRRFFAGAGAIALFNLSGADSLGPA
jgi:hypothetical protein